MGAKTVRSSSSSAGVLGPTSERMFGTWRYAVRVEAAAPYLNHPSHSGSRCFRRLVDIAEFPPGHSAEQTSRTNVAHRRDLALRSVLMRELSTDEGVG